MKAAMLDNLKESPEQVVGWFGRARRFLIDVRGELGRVTWPTRREVWATTVVVILDFDCCSASTCTSSTSSLSAVHDWAFTSLGRL